MTLQVIARLPPSGRGWPDEPRQETGMTGLWKTWINLWCWGVILFGAVLAAGAFPATDGFAAWVYGLLASEPVPAGFMEAPGLRFSVALMGAVTIGWGLTI